MTPTMQKSLNVSLRIPMSIDFHYFLLLASEEVMLNQETIWRETLANDSVTENEARSGRQLPAEVDQQMLHDIQVILSRLVAKARQLI